MRLIVFPDGRLVAGEATYRCALGRGGVRRDKREGDGATPIGVWPARQLWYRRDRLTAPPATGLPSRVITPADGWCDDPADPAYNRWVPLPYPGRHERLWRADPLYDLLVVLGYNDQPVVPGLGSAIFLHVAKPDYAATEGCVALARPDLLAVLARLGPGDEVDVRAES